MDIVLCYLDVVVVVNSSEELVMMMVCLCEVFQYDPGFQEDPSQPFSDSDDDINDTDG